MTELFNEKSLLAKLMAEENIIVEQKAVQTASFNLGSRVLTIPTFKETVSPEILDVLFSHEISHARNTPHDDWMDVVRGKLQHLGQTKIPKSILNVVEDARIEKLIKRKYPGLKPSYIKGYNELIEMGLFGEKVKRDNIDSFSFLDKLNLFFKIGHIRNYDYKFNEIEQDFITEIGKLETFNEVIDVSKRLCEYLKEKWEEETEEDGDDDRKHYRVIIGKGKKSKKSEKFEFDKDATYEFEYADEEDEEDEDYEDEEDSIYSGDEESEDNFSTNTGKGSEGDNKSKGDNYSDNGESSDDDFYYEEEFNIKSELDEQFNSMISELYSDECIGYLDIPDADMNSVVVDYKKIYSRFVNDFPNTKIPKNNYINFKRKSNSVVSYLVKEFELRKNADQMKKAKISKSGDINVDKLYSYRVNDNIFKKLTTIPNGKSHGMVFFLDWSGSMSSLMHETMQQLMNLVMFCQKVNVPYEVYAFTSNYYEHNETGGVNRAYFNKEAFINSGKKIIDSTSSFNLMNLLSSRMSKNEFVLASSILLGIKKDFMYFTENMSDYYYLPTWLNLGNTPLNEAIICGIDVVNKFKEKNKIQIVNSIFLTDGESNKAKFYNFDTSLEGTYRYGKLDYISDTGSRRNYIRYSKYKEIIDFKKSRKDWRMERMSESNALLNLFRKCTGSTLTGFYVVDPSYFKSVCWSICSESPDFEKRKEEFRKNNSTTFDKFGYDEYHFVKSTSMKIIDKEFDFDSKVTAKSIAKKFVSHVGRKLDNRIILQKFIKRIS